MTGTRDFKQKKNLLYFPDRDQPNFIEGAKVVAWEAPMPWYCTAFWESWAMNSPITTSYGICRTPHSSSMVLSGVRA